MNPAPEVILNVNDNEPNRYVTTRVLSRAGFTVLEAGTGAEGLRLAREARPPVIVLDVNLPDMSGIEVCRVLKTGADTASIMVLQMSATNIALVDRVEALAAGADSFLVEPVEPEELEAVTRALLRLHRSEASLRQTLVERELLLKEVNHRVKNSLQLVLSMLSLQRHAVGGQGARDTLDTAIARIGAIAAVHERLYQGDDPLSIEVRDYLTGLCRDLARAGIGDDEQCTLNAEIDPLRLPTDQGVSLALIVNELVINALKHARRPNRPVLVNVHLHRAPEGMQLTVADNGGGVGSPGKESGGLGTRLVTMLVRQLRGRMQARNLEDGYSVRITFPLPTEQGPTSSGSGP